MKENQVEVNELVLPGFTWFYLVLPGFTLANPIVILHICHSFVAGPSLHIETETETDQDTCVIEYKHLKLGVLRSARWLLMGSMIDRLKGTHGPSSR